MLLCSCSSTSCLIAALVYCSKGKSHATLFHHKYYFSLEKWVKTNADVANSCSCTSTSCVKSSCQCIAIKFSPMLHDFTTNIHQENIHKNTDVANSCSCSSALCIKSKYQCIAMQSGIFLFLLKFAVFTLFRNKYSFSQGKCAKMLTFLIHAAVVELGVLNQNLIIHYITENSFFNKKMSTFC